MSKKIVVRILIGFVVLIGIIQFIPAEGSEHVEEVTEKDFLAVVDAPEDVATIIRSACYDCHSYQTKYPWYSKIAPVSWWVGHHIEEGREHLNFSNWTDYTADQQHHKLEECAEEVEEGEMPLDSYTWAHSEAELTPEQVEKLEHWFEEQMEAVAH